MHMVLAIYTVSGKVTSLVALFPISACMICLDVAYYVLTWHESGQHMHGVHHVMQYTSTSIACIKPSDIAL